MKTMPILSLMLLVANAVAEPIFTSEDISRIVAENREQSDRIRSSAVDYINKPVDPNVAWAASPSKVDYSIVTLPDGKTASVLTFK